MIRARLIAKDSQKQLSCFRYPSDFSALTVTPLRKATPKRVRKGQAEQEMKKNLMKRRYRRRRSRRSQRERSEFLSQRQSDS
jgi:hypothetical protein